MNVLVNLDGFDCGIGADEVGMNIETFEQKTVQTATELENRIGNVRGVWFRNIHQEITWGGETTADPTVAIGDILPPLANLVSLGGVTEGAIILYELTLSLARTAIRKLSCMAKQFPGIPEPEEEEPEP